MSPRCTPAAIGEESEVTCDRLERCWFACMRAASAKREECEALLEVMAQVKASWHESRVELGKLEALRDALAETIADLAVERRALRACSHHLPVTQGGGTGRPCVESSVF